MLFDNNWEPEKFIVSWLVVIIFVMLFVQFGFVATLWGNSGAEGYQSNIVAGSVSSGANARFQQTSDLGRNAFVGSGEPPVFYDIGDVGATRDIYQVSKSDWAALARLKEAEAKQASETKESFGRDPLFWKQKSSPVIAEGLSDEELMKVAEPSGY